MRQAKVKVSDMTQLLPQPVRLDMSARHSMSVLRCSTVMADTTRSGPLLSVDSLPLCGNVTGVVWLR